MPASLTGWVHYRGMYEYGGNLSASKVSLQLQAENVVVEIKGDTGGLQSIRLIVPRAAASSLGAMLLSVGTGGAKAGELQL
jgi:hypothetical protein